MRNQHWVIRYPTHGLLLRILEDFRQIEKFWNNQLTYQSLLWLPSPREEVYELLDEYKKYFSLYDEIGLVQKMEINLEFNRQLSVKDMKSKIDKRHEETSYIGYY